MKTIFNFILIILISVLSTALYAQGLSCSQPEVVIPGNYNFSAYNGQSSIPNLQAGWYSYTPSNSGYLSISSCVSSSDTYLWIWSGSCSNLITIANNDDVFPGSPCSSLTNVPLLADSTYYFEWVNTYDSNPFNWSFSFVPLPNNFDSEINYLTNRYTKIPISQASNGITLGGTIKNLSGNNLTNVVLTAKVYELPNADSVIATFSSTPIDLNVGQISTVTCGIWSPVLANSNSFLIKYVKTQTEFDEVQSNDSIEQNLILDFNYMARDNNSFSTSLNFPTNGGCSQGVRFTLLGQDQLTGVQYFKSPSPSSQAHTIQVYSIDNGVINLLPIYSSSDIITNESGWLTHILPNAISLLQGEYLVSVSNLGNISFPLGCDFNIFTNETNYFKEGNLAWVPIESYGYNFALMIRPKFGLDPSFDLAFESNVNPGGEYTMIHSRQSLTGNELQFSAIAKNIGTLAIQNARMLATLKNSIGSILYQDTSDFQNLDPGQTAVFSVPNYTVTDYDDYSVEYLLLAPNDQVIQNNFLTSGFSRTKDKMSRTIGIDGSLGIGDNASIGVYDNAILGQTYTILNDDYLDSVEFVLSPSTPADQPVRVEIYSTDSNGIPTGNPIETSTTYITSSNDNLNGVVLKLPMSSGTLPLSAGTYFIGVIEYAGNVRLATSTKYHTSNRAFIKWDQNPNGSSDWTNVEQLNSFVSFFINPIFKTCIPLNNADTIISASCGAQDGSINNTFTGGTGDLSFVWSSGEITEDLDSLVSGIYSLTITDINMCSVSNNIVVPSLSDLSVVSSHVDVTCPNGTDGQIILTASNGVLPYTYSWSDNVLANDSALFLTAGSYSCSITDSTGCVVIIFDTLTELSSISLVGPGDITVCEFNSIVDINVLAQGGIGMYSYSWPGTTENQSTISNVSIGSYICVVIDSLGCSDSVSTQVLLTDLSVLANGTDLLCNGSNAGSVNISVDGGVLPYSYDWLNSTNSSSVIAGLSGGNYSCVVTDSLGCIDTVSVTLIEPDAINTTSNVTNEITGNDGAIDLTVTGGVSPYSFLWENNSTNQDLSSLVGGTYSFTITDANGCVYSDSVVVSSSVGINEYSVFEWLINPNPSDNLIQIKTIFNGNVLIFDVNGKLVISSEVSIQNNKIDISSLQSGVYLIQFNGQVQRLIKR